MNRSSLLSALTVGFLISLSGSASAVGTRTFELDTLDELEGGDLTGVSVASNGTVRAGYNLGSTPITDATSVWSAVVQADGTVLVGTGSEGKVFRVTAGQSKLLATTGEMAVSALAVAWNGDVIAGTFPEGKLFKLPKGAGDGGEAKLFAELEGAEHIWGLRYDDKAKALYVATGPDGKLFRVDQQGNAQVYYDSEESHLVSVTTAPDGTVYAGSSGKALLFKLNAPGRATVVHDFDGDDVKAIEVASDGTIYAIANKYKDGFKAPKKGSSAKPQSTKKPKPGKGELMRFSPTGVAERLLVDKDTHFVSLALADDGTPHVGTGAEGRVYTVDDNLVSTLVADTEERQISALLVHGKRRYIVGSDPAVYHAIQGVGGADAVWTSKVLDAGLRAHFGQLAWDSKGSVELSTRTGNTEEPDGTWSSWSAAMTAPGEMKSPAARYIQVRSRFSRDQKAELRGVKLHFVTDNARAVVTSIEATPGAKKTKSEKGIVTSGGPLPKPKSTIKVKWKVENPDKDELRFRLSYRVKGRDAWFDALKPGAKLTKTEYEWETSSLPEGTYELKLEATDELANPPDRVSRHTLSAPTVLVDNTPPVFKALSLTGRRLKGEVVDGLGPIGRIEVSVAGTEEWRPLFPTDSVFDEASEAFDIDVSDIVPPGTHLVAVRVYDSGGNAVTRQVNAQ